jgi:hypothetical protein
MSTILPLVMKALKSFSILLSLKIKGDSLSPSKHYYKNYFGILIVAPAIIGAQVEFI